MGNLTIRNLPDEVHQQLKLLAERNNRSTEAEARHILAARVSHASKSGLGSQIRAAWGPNTDGELHIQRSEDETRKVDFG